MTEILTESFCERCGTRYTFESARPRVRLKGVKVLSRGLKNFVLSDGTTMDEAMASARSETDRELTAHQLDAFHKTFNFCMTCRQYTCPDCWNEAEARCLTCAPRLLQEIPPAAFPDLAAPTFLAIPTLDVAEANGSNGANGSDELAAHPGSVRSTPAPFETIETDYEIDAAARLEAMTGAAWARPSESLGEPIEPGAVTPTGSPRRLSIGDKTAAQTGGLLKRFRPGQNLDAELEDYERRAAATPAGVDASPGLAEADTSLPEDFAAVEADAEATADTEVAAQAEMVAAPEVVAEAEPETVAAEPAPEVIAAEPEPEAVAVESEPEPEAVAAEPEPEPEAVTVAVAAEPEAVAAEPEAVAAEPEPEAVAAEPEAVAAEPEPASDPTPIQDVVPQPRWQIVAPDPAPSPPSEPAATIPAAATASTPIGEPQWPTRPEWLGGAPSTGLPFLNRPPTPQGGIDALWAESTREVVTTPGAAGKQAVGGVQPCVSCGLSLSATARFCRRCGTPQAS
jgi:hypothetical protein